MTKRVVVALSGGVDSSVTAYILKQQGYDVIGLTAKMQNDAHADIIVHNAQKVAEQLDIPFFVLDASLEFKEKVIDYFNSFYKQGLTPNPCIMCNKFIKWGTLFDYAVNELKADYVATGHYANVCLVNNEYKLYPADDSEKDQLYFLYCLNQKQLSKTLFPLARYKKSEIKKIAIEQNLPCKSSKESQDICFIQAPNTTKKYLNNILKPQQGYFKDIRTDKILGKHEGYWQYTIGQRKGIGIAASQPLYVIKIDSVNNVVYVGFKEDLLCEELYLKTFNWSSNEYSINKSEFNALVKIRYNMKAVCAKINVLEKDVKITFNEPVSAIAKGQACVLYDLNDGHLLGGAFI